MPFVPVPKDLNNVKTKVAFNLTKRQLICFSLAAATGIPIYFLTKNYISSDISALLMVAVMLPFFFVAMYEKDGQPFEKVFKNIIQTKFLWPKVRIYKTENLYQILETQNKIESEVKAIEAKAANRTGKTAASRKKGAQTGKKANKPHR